MRQTHIAGEKLFVDFAGRTGEVVDGRTGEIIPVQIFVVVLGASSFTYAEAVWSQKLPDWIAAHVRAFAYFGGTTRQTVSDNLKAASPRPVLRADGQSDLCRRGPALRHRDRPARPYSPGHASRGRGAGGRALDSGAVAAPALLRAGRTQRGDPGPASTRSTTARCAVGA